MTAKTTNTGRGLERRIADAYRAIGAQRVEHDIEIAGHQIDVYVEMETADRSSHRIAIEAKDHARPVGISIIAEYAAVVDGLRRLSKIDQGVVVSTSGFSKPARNAAREHGLRLLEAADLKYLSDPSIEATGHLPTREKIKADAGLPGAPVALKRSSGSPFVLGRALRANEPIFGRDDLFRSIAGQLAKFSSVNIVGERRMGKTSLLNHLIGHQEEHLFPQPHQPPLILARVDLQFGVANAQRFYGRALRELLDRLPLDQDTEGYRFQDIHNRLYTKPEATYDEFERILRHLRDSDDLCVRPVFIVDEFERLIEPEADKGFPYPSFFNGLRALITADLLAMIIFSCCPLAEYFQDPERPSHLTSTFPTYFTLFELRRLDEEAADDLLLQSSDHMLTLEDATKAKRWAVGHPCHLQVAGQALYEAKEGKRTFRWVRQRFKDLKAQSCMVNDKKHQNTTSLGWLKQAFRFIFVRFPVSIGRLAQHLGTQLDDVGAWFIGAAVIVIVVLALLGIVKGSEVVDFIKKGLGLE